ncbi:ATPase, AAA family protein [Tritrichomonas foetus]|uniref:Katanin p60 ATPase-containing subunit A-like 2 n=1 Tax=Tritrichomonas foetus TaxID=1144522 RepID=A0A1J4L6F8_9EUKA|nr:ATPase, AAA family protein [Tritrichomonas foetus]|eukprot:OHT17596.1 ATPase, AAA family protein [Tritrichomonas foetus]
MTLELRRPKATANKEAEEAERKRRLRDATVLCMNYMISQGYIDSAERLAQESGIPSDRYEICDNINFMEILIDYESFQELKYGQKPRLTKPNPKASSNQPPSRKGNLLPQQKDDGRPPRVIKPKVNPPTKPTPIESSNSSEHIGPTQEPSRPPQQKKEPENLPADVRLMKPIPLQLRADFGDLTSVIARDIYIHNPGVRWSDIVGLSETKRVLREAVVMPLKFPQLFAGKKLLTPWRGVLLHGPPGTGKTMLAKAVAGEGTTFFNVSVSTIVSKWRGDSEKLIRVLFELARYHAPSTIFIDELDAVMSKRSSQDEHEASRRMKTEFLIQMDGLVQSDALVFVLAASNFPFDLDPALLRRLEKRILVPLPEEESRKAMFESFLTPDIAAPGLDYSEFAKRTEGYSGSDVRLVCKEAAMQPLRRLMNNLQEEYGDSYLDEVLPTEVKLDLITREDVLVALDRTSASDAYDTKKYEQWQNKFGVV